MFIGWSTNLKWRFTDTPVWKLWDKQKKERYSLIKEKRGEIIIIESHQEQWNWLSLLMRTEPDSSGTWHLSHLVILWFPQRPLEVYCWQNSAFLGQSLFLLVCLLSHSCPLSPLLSPSFLSSFPSFLPFLLPLTLLLFLPSFTSLSYNWHI